MMLNDPYPSFKVTLFFYAEYFRNGTRCTHSFNGILIWTYMRPTQQCHFSHVIIWCWIYVRNHTRYRHSFNGTLIGTYTWSTQQCHFSHVIIWCWIYVRNHTRYRHSFNRMLIRDLLNSVISNDLEWLSEIIDDTKCRVVCLRRLSFLFAPGAIIRGQTKTRYILDDGLKVVLV